jgi:hypothetical protein
MLLLLFSLSIVIVNVILTESKMRPHQAYISCLGPFGTLAFTDF